MVERFNVAWGGELEPNSKLKLKLKRRCPFAFIISLNESALSNNLLARQNKLGRYGQFDD